MAYHLEAKAISRGAGRSAAGVCAYVAAGVAEDLWTGLRMDYRRKAKPVAVDYIGTKAKTPQEFAHALDSAEKRKNSTVARELIVALPDCASSEARKQIAIELSAWVSSRYNVPALCAIHRPDRQGDQRNHHAHIVVGTRDSAGAKVRILDDLKRGPVEIKAIRAYASALIQAQVPPDERPKWSHESLRARDVPREPTRHEGPMITAMRRKGAAPSLLAAAHNDEVRATIAAKSALLALNAQISADQRQRILVMSAKNNTNKLNYKKGYNV